MTEQRTEDNRSNQEMLRDLKEQISEAQRLVQPFREARRKNEENRQEQRRHDLEKEFLRHNVPDFAAPMRRLVQDYKAKRQKIENDSYLSREGKARKLQELENQHRKEAAEEAEAVRDRMESYGSRYRALARIKEEPADETRYARVEREFRARVESGQRPNLESYWDAIESGDADLIRVFEVYGPSLITDNTRRQEYVAEVESQRQARLSPEQKTARQRVRELEAKKNEFGMAIRTGGYGEDARRVGTPVREGVVMPSSSPETTEEGGAEGGQE